MRVKPGGQYPGLKIIIPVSHRRGRGCFARRRGLRWGGGAEGLTPRNPDLGDPLGAVWALGSVNCPADREEEGWRQSHYNQ